MEGTARAETFARWMQVGVLSPFFRAHCQISGNPQEPWAFGEEVLDIGRAALTERYRLLPYLVSLFAAHQSRGEPLLRPLLFDFPQDAATYALDDQGMLGPWLLAAPVLNEGATTRPLYLPAGAWMEWRSGARYQGPATITPNVTLAALPLFVREGAILPLDPPRQWADQAVTGPRTIEVLPGADGTTFTLWEDDGATLAYQQGAYAATLPSPPVRMPFRVRAPTGTPHDTPVSIALSSNGWQHVALEWDAADPTLATGLLEVPRGQWFEYKYARGDWDSAEVWPDCAYAQNRYAFGAALPGKDDVVWGWVDRCR